MNFPNVCENRCRKTVTLAGRCDGMSGNNSVRQNDQPDSIMVKHHPNETDLSHPHTPTDPEGPPNRPICAGLAHSSGASWCSVVNSPSSGDHLRPRCQIAPCPTAPRRGPLPKLLWAYLLLLPRAPAKQSVVFDPDCPCVCLFLCPRNI